MRIDDDVKQTGQDKTVVPYRLLRWFRTAPPDAGAESPVGRGPTSARTLAVAAVGLVLGVLVFLGVIAVALKVFESGVAPILTYLKGPVFRLILGVLFLPGALPALMVATVVVGLALAQRFQPRELFLTGVFVVALGFGWLWQLPRLMAALSTSEAEVQLEGPLLIGGLVISALLFVCGIQVMGHCQWVREEEDEEEGEDEEEEEERQEREAETRDPEE